MNERQFKLEEKTKQPQSPIINEFKSCTPWTSESTKIQ